MGVVALPIGLLLPAPSADDAASLVVAHVPILVGALVANGVLVKMGWTRWRTLGVAGWAQVARGAAVGLALGLGIAAVAVLIAVGPGEAEIVATGEAVEGYLHTALALTGVLAVAALAEELIFRGYPLARLARTVGKPKAALALAVLFGAAHLGNPEVSALGVANIALASLVLSAAFFTPGGLAAAWGVHLGWNAGLAYADAPVSGLRFDLPALDFEAGTRGWVTGGAFGPEGGIAASLAMGLALLWLARRAAVADIERRGYDAA